MFPFLFRIDQYTSKLFWTYFIAALLVAVTLFTAMDAMSTLVTYKGVSSEALLSYTLYSLPDFVYKMLPVACLMGTIMTLSSLNRANELVSLFAGGMSLLRVALPSLIWVALISIFAYFASDRILPSVAKQRNFVFYHEIKKMPGMFSVVKKDRIWYRSKNSIFNIKTLNPEAARAQGLSLYFFSEAWDLIQMITANEVEMNGTQWILKDGSVTLFNAETSFPLTSPFKSKTIVMGEDAKDLTSTGATSDLLNQAELLQFIRKNREAGLDTLRYEVDYHSKMGFAFAGLVMTLLGIPFTVGRARSGGVIMNLGICMALVFAYWVLYSSSLTLGFHGYLPPLVSAWLPSLLMVGLASFLLRAIRL